MSKRILYLGLNPSHYQHKGNDQIVHWPIIQIVPRPLSDSSIYQSLSQFASYSHVIITSKTTVSLLDNYLNQLNIDRAAWISKKTIAVGQVTAHHLNHQGIIPFKIAKEETAEGIIDELKSIRLKQAHVFWPHSSQARPLIKNFLIDSNIQHTTCILYDPQPQIPRPLPILQDFDEIVFTSPSTVRAFLAIFKAFPENVILTSIGPITDQFLTEKRNHSMIERG